MRIAIVLRQIAFLMVFALTMGVARAAESPVRVLVYGEHQKDNVVYHYTVINNGQEEFYNFIIASKYYADRDENFPELGKLPLGWAYGREGETGTKIILDSASTAQPAGWRPEVYGKQESGYYYLEWNTGDSGVRGVQPGHTLSGFSVTVPRGRDANMLYMPGGSDFKYITGHFRVGFYYSTSDRKNADVRGPIEKFDVTLPSISVTVAPITLWPPNNKLVPVTMKLSVKDDYDPQPEIKLESITANEPLEKDDIGDAQFGTDDRQFSLKAKRDGTNKVGRIYTITYSATDATGNKATASATVTVPHDERK